MTNYRPDLGQGFIPRGAFTPSAGVPTIADCLKNMDVIRVGDMFVAASAGTIVGVVNSTAFVVGDRIVYQGGTLNAAASWIHAGQVPNLPANVPLVVLSETDNNN